MRFKVNPKTLGDVLHPIARGVAAKNLLAGGDQVSLRVDAEAGILYLRSVCAGIDVTAEVKVSDVAEPLTEPVAVPATVLDDYLAHIESELVDIEAQDGALRVHNGTFSACFPIMEETFPGLREPQGQSAALVLDLSSFRDAVAALLPACAADRLRPQLQSAHVEVKDGVAEIVCTDSRILLLQRLPVLDGSAESVSANIPADAAAFLTKVFPADAESVVIHVGEDGKDAKAVIGPNSVLFPLVADKFPAYGPLLNAECPITATVSAAALKVGINIAQAADVAGIVQLDFRGSLLDADLTVTCEDILPEGSRSKATSTFACEYGGEDVGIVFPRKRLAEAIKALDCTDIEFRLRSPKHAAFLVAAHPEQTTPERVAMLMPMSRSK